MNNNGSTVKRRNGITAHNHTGKLQKNCKGSHYRKGFVQNIRDGTLAGLRKAFPVKSL